MHRDSVGSEQPIRPAEVNWMIAGRGITHSERFERARSEGGRLHGLQAWVALPDESEEAEPSFAHYGETNLPVLEDHGLKVRIIAGRMFGKQAQVKTYSPMFYAHVDAAPFATIELPPEYSERAAYVVSGEVSAGAERFHAGQMLVFGPGDSTVVTSHQQSVVMLLGGEPVGPRFLEWNFVSSSKERIEQAKADWRAGRMKLPDLDNGEFIPLPPDPPPPPNPMS